MKFAICTTVTIAYLAPLIIGSAIPSVYGPLPLVACFCPEPELHKNADYGCFRLTFRIHPCQKLPKGFQTGSIKPGLGVECAVYSNEKCKHGSDGFNWPLMHVKTDIGVIKSVKCWENLKAEEIQPLTWKGPGGKSIFLAGGWTTSGGGPQEC